MKRPEATEGILCGSFRAGPVERTFLRKNFFLCVVTIGRTRLLTMEEEKQFIASCHGQPF
jgi:hypothetical protein